MTHKHRFFLLVLLMSMVANVASAYDACIEGIYYNFSGTSATVTYKTSSYNSYTGNVVIPSSVIYNGSSYSVTSIGKSAFDECSGLTSVTIPYSVTSIGNYAFSGCSGLTSVTIPNSVTSIGDYAFAYCSGLTSVTIPNSVTLIGSSAFFLCRNLKNILLPDNLSIISRGLFNGCNSLNSILIPKKVEIINDNAFYGCSSLTSIDIPRSVKSIGGYSFYECVNLRCINIGDSIESIGACAFYNCMSLDSLFVRMITPVSISANVFFNCYQATLYVPYGSKATYQAADYWKEFKEIKEYELELEPVTLTAKNYTRVYGDANPAFEYEIDGGPVLGTPSLSCNANVTSPVGAYPIVINGDSVTNDSVTLVNGTLTIVPAPLTITAMSFVRLPGHDNPEFSVSYSGFKNGENESVLTKQPTITCSATATSPAGTYEIVPSGAEAQNYDISYENGILTVAYEDAVVSAVNKIMVYGDAVPELTYSITGGGLDGEPLLSTTATSTSPVGTYPITITQGSVNNPNVTYTNGTLTITKAPLTIIAKSYQRNYEQNNPTFEVIYNGFKNGDGKSVLIKEPTITCSATATSPVGTYEIVPSGAEAQNYDISYENGILTVVYEDAVVSAVNKIMVYGDAVPKLTYNIEGGALDGIPQLSTTATSTSSVGTYPITITQGSVNNPNVTYTNGTLTITKAPLTITAKSYQRNIRQNNPVFEATYSGFKNGEDKSVLTNQPTITCSATQNSPLGTYDIIPFGAQAQNYCISYVNGTLSIVDYILFVDDIVQSLCLANWDRNNDGYLSKEEAAAVTDIGSVFRNSSITSFDELKYFTGLTTIPAYAFDGCANLASIIIPESVTTIGDYAFRQTYLKSLTIGSGVQTISQYAFRVSSSSTYYPIKTIWLTNTPPTNYSYAAGTVNYVSNSQYTSISNTKKTVYSFLSSMFEVDGVKYVPVSPSDRTCDVIDCRYDSSTEHVNVDSMVVYQGIAMTVKEVKKYAFYQDNYIKEVQLSNKGSVGSYSYYGCSGMNNATISNQGSIGDNAFASSKINGTLVVNNAGNIGANAFNGTTGAFTANVNNTGTINSSAFYNSTGLKTLEIGSNVTNIASEAFKSCSNLQTATLQNRGTIGNNTFQSCSKLQTTALGQDITSIGQYAFNGCSLLEGIIIPDAVSSIGAYAFQNCSKMSSVQMGTGVTTIATYTFSGCSSLTDMQMGENVISIDTYAFAGCSALPIITIPKAVTSVNNYAFQNCSHLATVIMEDKDDAELSFGSNGSSPLFANCPLDSVYIGRNITYSTGSNYGYSPFYRNTSLRSVTITDRETEISDNEFYGCTNLKNVRIGDGVTTIGKWAFSGCSSLDYFAFGSSLTTIGQEAFSDCTSVTNIISRAETPPTCGTQALDDINKWTCHLSVLPGTASAYQAANQWKEFFYIEETAQADQPVASVTLSYHSVVLEEIGGTIQLTATVLPYAAVNKHVVWSSDNEQVATVENGLVTALGYGTAHVTATSEVDADKKDICLVTVRESPTVTAVNKTMIYGDSVPELTYEVNGGILDGVPELSTSATSSSPVGTYPIVVGQGSIQNDKTTYVYGTLTILPAPLVITANSYVRKLGDENPTFEATYTGFKNGEDKNVLIQQPSFTCSATTTSAEGEYTIFVADAQAQNYEISYINGTLSVVDYITFADSRAGALCVNNWDTNQDGFLSKSEAASVTNIGTVFRYSNITSFDELKYFTGLTSIPSNAFYGCRSLTTITIPQNIISIGSSAFYNCSQCSSITLPDDIISIGTSAFTSSIKLYVNRGTRTLLALWNANYTSPYETETETVLPPSSISVETTTQMTASVMVNNFYAEYTNTLNDEQITSESITYHVRPEYSESLTLKVSKGNVTYMPSSITFTTKRISPTATRTEATASSMTVVASYLEGDAPVTDQTLTVNGVTVKGNSLYIHGLSPGSSYKATYTIKVDDKYEYTGTTYLSTYSLSFTNSQPKVISEGNVIVASTSNLDEEETNVGFEWRRTDWTNEFMSETAVAYLYQGTIEGYIRDLKADDNILWKFRPYYEADNGSRYYGSWTGIDPTNTSYFEPTVHTYARIEVIGNNATVKGYAMRGSDNIVSQGFKYWEDNASKGNQIPSNATTVEASGTVMNVELTDLSYNTTYRCVAFATTTEGETFYGEEMSFTTETNILGDVNFDGQISIADVTALVNIILGKDNSEPYQYDHDAADVNGDGNISIADVTALVNIILGKGPSPTLP